MFACWPIYCRRRTEEGRCCPSVTQLGPLSLLDGLFLGNMPSLRWHHPQHISSVSSSTSDLIGADRNAFLLLSLSCSSFLYPATNPFVPWWWWGRGRVRLARYLMQLRTCFVGGHLTMLPSMGVHGLWYRVWCHELNMVMHAVCMVRWPSANMFMRHASKRCSLATDQKSITTAPWLLTMEVCASPIPDVVLSASVVDPGSFGLLPSITFLPKLEMFQSLFICCVHM